MRVLAGFIPPPYAPFLSLVLSHIRLIVDHAPGIFDDEFKQFFAKFNEPTSVKALKMGILPKLANPANAREVVAELTE